MAIKIKFVTDPETGEECVPPRCMEILLDYGRHRNECADCSHAYASNGAFMDYCPVGRAFIEELCRQPEVSEHPD